MINLLDLPNDIFVEIICFTINDINDINNICNFFCKIPSVSQNLEDEHWKIFCKMINIPDNFKLNTWKNTFYNINHVDTLLANYARIGNFYKIRNLEDKIKTNYSNNRLIPKRVLDHIFSCKDYDDLLQIFREILIFPIDPKANFYLKNILKDISDNYFTYGNLGVHIFREINWHIKKFNLSIDIPQNLDNDYYY